MAVALARHGCAILERNWRTRWCEIDIVAEYQNVIRFVEVKYRRTGSYGDGYTAITTDKQQRLQRAALSWLKHHNRSQDSYVIDFAILTGDRLRYHPGG